MADKLLTLEGAQTLYNDLRKRLGVVPADITKNLWALGEVAPMFAKAMKTGFSDIQGFGTQDKSVDESFNVGTVNMTVNADNTFDVDKWVNELKVKTALSRNIR